jgi:prepilin-type N-terminal cleavage/methylation domain-containing protein
MSLDKKASRGFSLLELLIAMVVTLTLMTVATSLLASALRVRTRENQKSDALADTQRALNIMSREIANAGFNLTNNGIVAAESGTTRIRIRSNLNHFDYSAGVTAAMRNGIGESGEDLTYFLNDADNTKYLVRHDEYLTTGYKSTVLANRIDAMNIHYFDQKVTYTAPPGALDIDSPSATPVDPANAKYIVIAIAVTLDAVGDPATDGYQPPYTVLLCSDVDLRNTTLWGY